MYRKIVNCNEVEKLQIDLGGLGEWAVEIGMKINAGKTGARMKDPLNYSLLDQEIPEVSSCKNLGIILHSDLSWTNQFKYKERKKKAGRHFISQCMFLKKETVIREAYTSLMRPILKYGAACWDPFRGRQINELDHL
jgi:hypothetical protein